MIGVAKALLKFMDGSDTRFVIPVYQRNYDWQLANCRQLFSDLLDVVAEDKKSHFFGSIVATAIGSEYEIIDGQQRLTSVSLLLLAIAKAIKAGEIAAESPVLADKILKTYLVDEWQPTERKAKLKPIKNDMEAFDRLFGPPDNYIRESHVTQNYLFFYTSVVDSGVSPDSLFEAIKKLEIIDITLEKDDDPQLIFESLNSTGLDLSEADKIRNFVLMNQSRDMQELLYEQYWNLIEQETDFHVSELVRQYLTYKQAKWPNMNRVYMTFKEYVKNSDETIEQILGDVLRCARIYKRIKTSDAGSKQLNLVMARINRMDVQVVYPLLFALFIARDSGDLSDRELVSILRELEAYVFRRLVCDVGTNALNKVFATLNSDVQRLMDTNEVSYQDAFMYVLMTKTTSSRFPKDDEFEEAVRTKDFYNMRQQSKVYLFDRLENRDSYELVNVPGMMMSKDNGLTIEHVMPQHLSSTWREALGDNWESIHAKWLNKIANLTLTGYNSSYSNKSFPEKKKGENGFDASPLRLNKWIAMQDKWGVEELQAREEAMVLLFKELWPYPDTSFRPQVKVAQTHYLSDEYDFTSSDIEAFTFLGSRFPVKTWREAAENVIRQIYELDPATLMSIAALPSFPGDSANYLSRKNKGKGWAEINEELYVNLATSTSVKITLLEAIFKRVGISTDELCFELMGVEE